MKEKYLKNAFAETIIVFILKNKFKSLNIIFSINKFLAKNYNNYIINMKM